ncbi:outer membrane protein [Sphingomonas tabacisoli]|uniref:Outer membrane protein n=1 Tax=Sphingomonas tabacisoli TaxID=2249466 RepID=A0ABW4I0C2_9SPHN
MRKITVLAAAVAAAVSAPAFAGVTGPRAEAVVGWDSSHISVSGVGSLTRSGLVYGLGVGYDFGIGSRASFGIDAEATDATTDVDVTDGTGRYRLAIGRDLYVGGRVTAAVSDKLNVYAKAGYTNARVKGSITAGGTTSSGSANADGIRGGLGLQYALGSKAYLGAEYRYSNYEGGFSRNQVVGTIGFRF